MGGDRVRLVLAVGAVVLRPCCVAVVIVALEERIHDRYARIAGGRDVDLARRVHARGIDRESVYGIEPGVTELSGPGQSAARVVLTHESIRVANNGVSQGPPCYSADIHTRRVGGDAEDNVGPRGAKLLGPEYSTFVIVFAHVGVLCPRVGLSGECTECTARYVDSRCIDRYPARYVPYGSRDLAGPRKGARGGAVLLHERVEVAVLAGTLEFLARGPDHIHRAGVGGKAQEDVILGGA